MAERIGGELSCDDLADCAHTIPFTQYLLPDGRQRRVAAPVSAQIASAAERFIESGGWFEAEILTTGHVSLTACKVVDHESRDVEIEVVPNGPEVSVAVERLVRKASEHA